MYSNFVMVDSKGIMAKSYSKIYTDIFSIQCANFLVCMKSDSHEIYKQHREFGTKGNHLYMLWMGWMPLIFSEKDEYAEVILRRQVNLQKSFS